MEEKTKITKEGLWASLGVLKKYLKKYRRETVVLSALGIVSAFGNGTIPLVAGRFFDAIITPSSFSFLDVVLPLFAWLLIIWTAVQIITYSVDWQINIKSENFSNKVWVDYWAAGVGYILTLPMSYHKSRKVGEMGEKINRAAFSLETIIGRIVIDLAPQFLSILIALGVTFYLKPILAVALIVGIVSYTVILARSVLPIAHIQREYQKNLWQAFGDSYDLFGNISTVKQATTEHYEAKRMENLLTGPVLSLWNKMNRIWSNLTLAQRTIIIATQLVIFIASVTFIQRGEMTLGDLLAFNAYATMMFGPFVTIGRQWQVIQNGVIQIEDAEKILKEPPENYHPKGGDGNTKIKGDVCFENVSAGYEGRNILKDISFEVKAGEIVALVGESGVGKTTLIELISGYNFPTSGKVFIDGREIREIDLLSLRQEIGVVPQEVALFNDTISHNIKYGSFHKSEKDVEEAARKAHAYDFIESFPEKWNQLVGERGVKLSVGQKQRVGIARAILREPKILILDEPTSALDASSEKIITDSLKELMKNRTTFIIAHRLSTVRRADKILVFKDGQIVEKGRHDELVLIKDGEYRRLYELQIGLHE